MNEWSVQDWSAVLGVIIAAIGGVCGFLMWLNKYLKNKYVIRPAKIRVNFFKYGKGWRFRIYNSSDEEIEALNLKVHFSDEDTYNVNWNSDKEMYPSLKQHASFDIHAYLYESSPRFTTITLEWEQAGSNKIFTTKETVSLH